MSLKKLFGIGKKESLNTEFESTKISGISDKETLAQDFDGFQRTSDNKSSEEEHNHELTELQELSVQNYDDKDFKMDNFETNHLSTNKLDKKLVSNSKNPFEALKRKLSGKKDLIETTTDTDFTTNDESPSKSKIDLSGLDDIKFDNHKENVEFNALNQEEKEEEKNEVLHENEGLEGSFTKPSIDEQDELFLETDAFKNLDVKSHTASDNMFSDNIFESNQKTIPVIGKLPITRQYQIVGALAALSLVGLMTGGFLYGNANSKASKAIQFGTEFSTDTQKLGSTFSDAVTGKNKAFDNLTNLANKTKADFELVKQNTSTLTTDPQLAKLQNDINNNLLALNKNIDLLRTQADLLSNSSDKVAMFNSSVNDLNASLDEFIKLYTQQNLNQNELANVYSLKTNLQVVNGSLATMLLSDKADTIIADNLNKARQDFKNSLVALQVGDPSKGINPITQQNILDSYQKISQLWIKLSAQADTVTNKSNDLITTRGLLPKNEAIVNDLIKNATDLVDIYKNQDLTGVQLSLVVLGVSLFALVLSAIIAFYVYTYERENRSVVERVENDKNQSSILKLLNEMMPLQDGDLTKKTTVTEEITGAIADSINATIDSLASLVKKIKDTSLVMREKTNEVNLISFEMLKTTENQADSLNKTGSAVIEIATAITEISKKTEQGAQEAKKSVEVSEQGAEQVLSSVKSMQEINNHMNETVHLMKKVGDSSKQISEIVELLSDITEETSILALNATVQAAKAGEAGKGFKIVADSIQELANKAGEAARRVGVLISAVQTDIQAVENAVEKTTSEVDKGVTLSEKAGESLNKMRVVSKELSEIVATISEEAKSHANSAKKVSENMKEILKTTELTKNSTEKTAHSIAEISDISNELGESVQSFKVE